jgi:hypothetical protein
MLTKLQTRSSRCLPYIKEFGWLCATFDVFVTVTWIDTKSNLVADTLSRFHAPDHDQAIFDTVTKWYDIKHAADPVWKLWPPLPPARPELLPHIPIAMPDDYLGGLLDLDESERDRILPAYLVTTAQHQRNAAPWAERIPDPPARRDKPREAQACKKAYRSNITGDGPRPFYFVVLTGGPGGGGILNST